MQVKPAAEDAKARCKPRKPTIEPVFGIAKLASERTLIALACNGRRLHRLRQA